MVIRCSVPASLGKEQGAKQIGHNLARERPKSVHNFVRKRQKIGLANDTRSGHNFVADRNYVNKIWQFGQGGMYIGQGAREFEQGARQQGQGATPSEICIDGRTPLPPHGRGIRRDAARVKRLQLFCCRFTVREIGYINPTTGECFFVLSVHAS